MKIKCGVDICENSFDHDTPWVGLLRQSWAVYQHRGGLVQYYCPNHAHLSPAFSWGAEALKNEVHSCRACDSLMVDFDAASKIGWVRCAVDDPMLGVLGRKTFHYWCPAHAHLCPIASNAPAPGHVVNDGVMVSAHRGDNILVFANVPVLGAGRYKVQLSVLAPDQSTALAMEWVEVKG